MWFTHKDEGHTNAAFHLQPILADGIDLPLLLLFGFTVVAPVLLFQPWPGLDAGLRIALDKTNRYRVVLNPGIMHFSQLWFENPRFLHAGRECLFEGETAICLLDLAARKVGKVMDGHTYILLSPAYEKKLD